MLLFVSFGLLACELKNNVQGSNIYKQKYN